MNEVSPGDDGVAAELFETADVPALLESAGEGAAPAIGRLALVRRPDVPLPGPFGGIAGGDPLSPEPTAWPVSGGSIITIRYGLGR